MTSPRSPLRILVCVKQVLDPETPLSAFKVDSATKRVLPVSGVPPVVNGFDENAVEAALRLKDAAGGEVTVLSVGQGFVMDVMKKPLSMGADHLALVDDPALSQADALATAKALASAIRREGQFDLVLCGRQASDWDQALVPAGIAELLGLPCVTLAKAISVRDGTARIERVLPGMKQIVECPLPMVVTVSNELGEPRYPTLRGIMAASRKAPVIIKLAELRTSAPELAPRMTLTRLSVPERRRTCEFVQGQDEADSGRLLALRLRQEKLI